MKSIKPLIHYLNLDNSYLTVIYGERGTGRTTLANKICNYGYVDNYIYDNFHNNSKYLLKLKMNLRSSKTHCVLVCSDIDETIRNIADNLIKTYTENGYYFAVIEKNRFYGVNNIDRMYNITEN